MTKKKKNGEKSGGAGFSEPFDETAFQLTPPQALKKGNVSERFENALKAVETIGQKKPN